jgi:N-carbamoylputrescine amidase
MPDASDGFSDSGSIDLDCRRKNLDAAIGMILAAAEQGSQVICLQELFTGPYPCQSEDHRNFDLAESIPGPTTDQLSEIAAKHQLVIVAPLFERRAPGLYHNSAAVIDADGSIAGVYRKMHIPDDPLFYEKFYFAPGDLGFMPIQTRYAKLGVGICWDQWYPEAARLFALAGAEILFYPTAIGWIDEEKQEFGAGQQDAWRTTMRAHAIANGIWLAAPNRVGVEGRLEFWGSSFIASPRGEIVQQADDSSQCLVTADCQLGEIDVVRTHWPFFRDRRIDAYDGLTRRWLD